MLRNGPSYVNIILENLEVSGLTALVDLIDNLCWWIWAIGGVRTYCATPIAYLEVSGLIVLVELLDDYLIGRSQLERVDLIDNYR